MNFYISITTIKKYKIALDNLLSSLPYEWHNKYILVYQDEPENDIKVFEDGHIEVYIENNLSDYGNWVGVYKLLEQGIVPDDSWFLFVHDTCHFLDDNSVNLTYDIIKTHENQDVDIIWLSSSGQCNICLIRKNGIKYGHDIYKDIEYMTKMETVHYEWCHCDRLSPKSFNVIHRFLDAWPQHCGKRFVYNNTNHRDVLLYKNINMEKYYFHVNQESDHPWMP